MAGTARAGAEDARVEVVRLRSREGRAPHLRPALPSSAVVVLVALVLALSPVWTGFYDQGLWEPLALAAVMLLVVVVLANRARFSRAGLIAGGALLGLLGVSVASMLWAQSKENAWTDTNQLAFYVVLFAIGLITIRERSSARTVLVIFGVPALATSIVLSVVMIAGGGQGAFLTGRLNSPLGYINGTAGLLAIGLWPWFALAESASRRAVRAAALAAATTIASTAVLTQSRAIVPTILLAALVVLLAAPQRTRRAVHLLVLVLGVAVGLHWTLEVYRSTGPAQLSTPPHNVLRAAGLAILAGGLLAGVLKLALSGIDARIPSAPRRSFVRATGAMLIAGAFLVATLIGVAGHRTIANQYGAFTQMKLQQSAGNRFLTAGGFRYDLWRVAIDEFKSYPIGGLGAGNYDTDYYRLRRNESQYVIVPHSLELQMAAELGILGLLALIVFCGTIFWAGFGRRVGTLASGDPMIKVASLGIFTAWLAGTSVDWLYNFPGLTGAAMVAAALLVVPDRRQRDEVAMRPSSRTDRSRLRAVLLVCTMGVLALVAASIGRHYAATRYAASGGHQVARSPRQALATLRTAEQLDPYELQTYYDIASAYARLDDYPAARDALLAAQEREPNDYVPSALLGDLAMRAGRYHVALSAYLHARTLNPLDPIVRQDLVQARAARR